MNLLRRFRYWIAEPLLAKLRGEHVAETTMMQHEAYKMGHKTGFEKGQAWGQLQGQQLLLCDLTRLMDERKAVAYEVTEADLERAKKGMVH